VGLGCAWVLWTDIIFVVSVCDDPDLLVPEQFLFSMTSRVIKRLLRNCSISLYEGMWVWLPRDVPRRSAFLSVILESNNGRASDYHPAMTRWCCYRRLFRRWLHLSWIEYHRASPCLGLATGTTCSWDWRRPRVYCYNAELMCPKPP